MRNALCIAVVGAVVILGYVKYLEIRGIYYPVKEISLYPSSRNIPYEDIYFNTEDNLKINGWFIPQAEARYTLLFFHGNAGNIGNRLDKLSMLWKKGLNIFIIDYRGFGNSAGRVYENGLYRDAKAAYDYLVNSRRIPPDKIIIYGESLGTAVAIDLATKIKSRALILEGAFSRGKDMAATIYPFLPNFIFSNSFDSLAKIKNITAPKLFIHSRSDEVVPFALFEKLYRAALEPKEFAEISGDHNNGFLASADKYLSAIDLFIEKLK